MTGRGDGERDEDPDDAPGKKDPPATEALRDPPDSKRREDMEIEQEENQQFIQNMNQS